MAKSAKWKRIEAAINGEPVDRVPFGFWSHFPLVDRNPEKLAQVTIEQQRRYDMDYVKVMFRSTWGVEDWGCLAETYNPVIGSWVVNKRAIQTLDDWRNLKPLAPDQGALGEQLYLLRKVAEEIKGDAPVLATLFSPSMLAAKLAGTDTIERHLKEDPAAVRTGIEVISETLTNFAIACLQNGADSFFFAFQEAQRQLPSGLGNQSLGELYDKPLLEKLVQQSNFIMLHAHGDNLKFDEIASYPGHVINWYDREAGPSLREARAITAKALAGGIDHDRTLLNGSPAEIAAEIREAISQVNGTGLIIAPGCGTPITVTAESLEALRSAIAG